MSQTGLDYYLGPG